MSRPYFRLSLFFVLMGSIHHELYAAPKDQIQTIRTSRKSNYREGKLVTSITADGIVENGAAKNVFGVIGSTYYLGASSIPPSILVLDAAAAAWFETGAAILVADGYGGHTDNFEDEQIFNTAQANVDQGLQKLLDLSQELSTWQNFMLLLAKIKGVGGIRKNSTPDITEHALRSCMAEIRETRMREINHMFASADSMLVGGRAFRAQDGSYDFFAFNVGDSIIIGLSPDQNKKWHSIEVLCPACRADSEQQLPSLPAVKAHQPHEVIIKISKNILPGTIVLAISDGVYDALGGIHSENSKFVHEKDIIDYLNASKVEPELEIVVQALIRRAIEQSFAQKNGDDFCIFGVKL